MSTDLELERAWWGTCANTFHEEQKQLVYADRMGLRADWTCGHPPQFDAAGASIVDVGGGPASLLLKTINAPRMMVIDPCPYPDWVYRRYAECGIDVEVRPGEHWAGRFDEGWIYNCLQHVEDPERVVCAMQANCRRIRVFEWVGIPAYDGHPHELDARLLEQWLGARGTEEYVNQDGAVGLAFFGVF